MDRIVDHADRVEQFSRCGNQHRFVTGHHPGPFLKSNRRSAQFGSWVKLLRWFSEKGDAAVGVDRRYQTSPIFYVGAASPNQKEMV